MFRQYRVKEKVETDVARQDRFRAVLPNFLREHSVRAARARRASDHHAERRTAVRMFACLRHWEAEQSQRKEVKRSPTTGMII